MLRKVALTLKPKIVFEVDGAKWTMKHLSTFKDSEISFKMGEEFNETTMDGRKFKVNVDHGKRSIIETNGLPVFS